MAFATPQHDAAFHRSPLVQRDLARHNASCSPVAATLAQLHASYASLERVLVLDASANSHGVNGIGNLFGDYLFWFGLAAGVRRALFLHWSGPRGGRFDLGAHFRGERHADWAWTARTQQRLQQQQQRARQQGEASPSASSSLYAHLRLEATHTHRSATLHTPATLTMRGPRGGTACACTRATRPRASPSGGCSRQTPRTCAQLVLEPTHTEAYAAACEALSAPRPEAALSLGHRALVL